MPRRRRNALGGTVYHVLNRANAGGTIFATQADFQAFLNVLVEAQAYAPMRTLDYCLMPTHWHLVLWPEDDNALSRFMKWLETTHTQRWHAAHDSVGFGHVYQGRFKSFPVQNNHHYLTVCRYVERNPVRKGLVPAPEEWPWSGLFQRRHSLTDGRPRLDAGPLEFPEDWLSMVNTTPLESEDATIRVCIQRGRPFGGPGWTQSTAERLGLSSTLRPRGRPREK